MMKKFNFEMIFFKKVSSAQVNWFSMQSIHFKLRSKQVSFSSNSLRGYELDIKSQSGAQVTWLIFYSAARLPAET